MIEITDGRLIHLKGKNTSYIFHITDTEHLEHIYYGKRLENIKDSERALIEKNLIRPSLSLKVDEKHPGLDLNAMALEASFEGKGDFKTPFLRIRGKKTLDFRYSGHRTYKGIRKYSTSYLPQAEADQESAETLEILLEEKREKISLILVYTLFEKYDAISRRSIVINNGEHALEINKISSMQLDIYGDDFTLVSLAGAPLRECEQRWEKIGFNRISLTSRTMSTGCDNNSTFAILNSRNECYISGLLYSSDFITTFEQSQMRKLHILSGISDEGFSWRLGKSDELESPEALLCYSEEGLFSASERFKNALRETVMKSAWKTRLRPVTLSTREITGLDVNEDKVESLLKEAKSLGFECIVIDDGWFGVRRERSMSLGDWYVNSLKFPEGLKKLSSRIHHEGLLFGLYFDIETVSKSSNLYSEKKDWLIADKRGKEYSSNENDFILDFTNPDVVLWAEEAISKIIELTDLDYIRYDKSRLPSEIFVDSGEFSHRYIMGVYSLLERIMKKYPDIIIETSFFFFSRFDLGMLSYSALMRLTENTDPISRTKSIEGARIFFPEEASLVTLSSSPDPTSGKYTSIDTRFNSSVFTAFEYSLDILALSAQDGDALKAQIEFYKQYRSSITFARVRTIQSKSTTLWSLASKDGSIIILLYLVKELPLNDIKERLFIEDANESSRYRIYTRRHAGSAESSSDSASEIECYEARGDAMRWAGIALSERYGGYEFTEDVRKIEDNSSRLYIIREIK